MERNDTISVKFTVVIQKEENCYVAKCLENNVTSQGKTIEELALLQDANPNFDIKPFNDKKDIIISNLSNIKTDRKSKSKWHLNHSYL